MQFTIYRNKGNARDYPYLLNVQSDIIDELNTRMVIPWPCCTIPKQDSSLSGADFAQLTCCRTGIPNPVILLIAFTHASASPTCAL